MGRDDNGISFELRDRTSGHLNGTRDLDETWDLGLARTQNGQRTSSKPPKVSVKLSSADGNRLIIDDGIFNMPP